MSTLKAAFWVFFFFQAEDGIRDIGVTGVQTCALPISTPSTGPPRPRSAGRRRSGGPRPPRGTPPRSEERRVGKECRSRWAAEHEKKIDKQHLCRGKRKEGCQSGAAREIPSPVPRRRPL